MPSPAIADPARAVDAAAVHEALVLARRLDQVALPPARLSGWSSLCSTEYAAAARRLQRTVAHAAAALHDAGRAG